MNFNKCSRCGCFFLSDRNVCPNCQPKDQFEINRLKDFIEENGAVVSNLDTISASTGISIKNLNRFLAEEQFADFASQVQTNQGNVGIQL